VGRLSALPSLAGGDRVGCAGRRRRPRRRRRWALGGCKEREEKTSKQRMLPRGSVRSVERGLSGSSASARPRTGLDHHRRRSGVRSSVSKKSVASVGSVSRPTIRAVSHYDGAQTEANRETTVSPSLTSIGASSLGGPLKILSGTSNEALAQEVAHYLGIELGHIKIKNFADGETHVQLEESIRGCDVFLVQSTCPPTNDHLMELLIMIDAAKRASARNITAVLPYFGYARADRKASGRESITAKLVANLLTEAGADRVLALDLHSLQSLGYFDIPVDHVYGQPVLLDFLASKGISNDIVVVSPDVGGVARARAFAKLLDDAPLAIIDKRRASHNVAEVMNVIGEVEGKIAVMVDDMIDTAGTITKGAEVLLDQGAKGVIACTTHAVFSDPAVERLSSGLFQEVIVTNSIPLKKEMIFPQLTILSVASLLGETIWRVHNSSSMHTLVHINK